MKRGNNLGFSLVELIIVIAIMAILLGIMAPQLIKYIEKTNVASDIELCDSVKEAIEIAAHDPAILSANDNSYDMIYGDIYNTAESGHRLDKSYGDVWLNCAFSKEVEEILGFNPFASDSHQYMKSSPAKTSGGLMCVTNEDGTDIAIFITHSDISGKKEDHEFEGTYISDLDASMVIYSK